MNEYNDAIQRLEISERPPGTMVSRRDKFYVPRKDTPSNWNYIFRNTGNMNIPKYYLPQILILNNHNMNYVDTERSNLKTKMEANTTAISTNKSNLTTAKGQLTTNQSLLENATTESDISKYTIEVKNIEEKKKITSNLNS